ncbi:MAG: ECF transporter S component [Clostridia bacterium]|nr:ECF transporter S component [Clostridia bacterium]
MKSRLSKNIAFAACLTSLVCVATYALAIPLPIGGYFNVGDVFVLLSGWLLGPWYGALAAGLGSGLADLFLGYTAYAPATFMIKGGVALVAWGGYAALKKLCKKEPLDFLPRLLSGLLAELIMVMGYFFFEAVLLQTGLGAAGNILGNTLQATCGLLGGTAVISALYPLPKIASFFPRLHVKSKGKYDF